MYTGARNRCTRAHRYGLILPELEDTALHLRRRYHQAIRDAKRRHWKEFLSEVDNIWKVARYLEPEARTIGSIPALCSGGRTADDDQGKAQALLETFFPPLPSIQSESVEERPQADALPMEEIAPHEIETALMKMASWKAPGPDGLPAVVWQQVRPTVKQWVVEIFQASIRLSYFPLPWKVAKIVVVPKGRRDPSLPKSYRPISLFADTRKGVRGGLRQQNLRLGGEAPAVTPESLRSTTEATMRTSA